MKRNPFIVGLLFGGIGYGLARGIAYALENDETEGYETTFVDPKAVENDTKRKAEVAKGGKKIVLQVLSSPLSAPLRKPTPHGYYGARRPTDSKQPFDHSHQGVDLGGTAGEKILAVGNGKIVPSNAGKGEIVRVLLLDDGRAVVYADIGTPLVEPGAILKPGDVVGLVRPNGFVHVAIRESRYGKFIDPTGVIPYDASSIPKKTVS